MTESVRLPADLRHTHALESLLADLDADALRWVSGFVAGLAAERARRGEPLAVAAPVAEPMRVTVLYASQTGNARRLAERLGAALGAAGLDALIRHYRLDAAEGSYLARHALACVSMPTCPLGMAEAERYLPALSADVERLLADHGLADEPLSLRITGCPNGCARPYVAEIGLVGKAPGRYNLHLGGDAVGSRLNVLYRENVDESTFHAVLGGLFAAWREERTSGERFGDFVWRTKRLPG